ncbi:hypothetical protein RUM43_008374 [Polyplax serrata]|uniref:Phospholipase A-2-activating protein n=1 Tax=Polyplax serrata TaxID=468196 RepID=A0AAN8S8D3_POLSC
MASQPYKLSCSIYGHNGDVRAVAVTKDGKIVSGSRDMTAKLWIPNESGCGFKENMTLSSHKNFVACVCVLPPSKKFSNELIVTGSNDKAIRLFDVTQTDPITVLNDHTSTVCKIVGGIQEDTILSSSWDQTAKLWDLVSCKVIAIFSGHEAAVWSAIQLPCGTVVTGAADRKIKIWMKNGTCRNTLNGHTDCIRDLAIHSAKEILSCSNDATVRHWNVETGQCLNIFYGHGHFVYSIFHIDSTTFLTSSEDHTIKLWKNGEVTETICVPANSIWSVTAMPNGDIVAGSSDGVIRVFSADVTRHADQEELAAYEEQISKLEAKSVQQLGGAKFSELPGKDALLEKGTTDGQTKLIRVENEVLAYSWAAAESKWNLIGNVTGCVPESEEGKPKYKGKAYDYVFSVDIEPGKPLLKLPYNKTDDPWVAAQKFIHENELSQHFLDEVANFIIKNTNFGDEQIKSNSSEFVDPFTGGARYIPGVNSDRSCAKAISETLAPGVSKNQSGKENLFGSSCYFPQREYLRFDQANVNLIYEKLSEFNKRDGNGQGVVGDTQIRNLIKTCEFGAHCTAEDLETLEGLLEWPDDILFPVLDVMRLAIRNTEANNHLCNDKLIPKLMGHVSPGCRVTSNTMLAFRVLANMMSGEAGLALAYKNKLKLLSVIESIPTPLHKSVQVAMSTVLLNMSVMLRRSETPDGRTEALSTAQKVLPNFSDQEALFRALVALGTLIVDMVDRKKHSSDIVNFLMKHENDSSNEPKIQHCCRHLLQVLR